MFGEALVTRLPALWQLIQQPLIAYSSLVAAAPADPPPPPPPPEQLQPVVHALQLLRVVGPHAHASLRAPALCALLPHVAAATGCGNGAVRQAAAACLAALVTPPPPSPLAADAAPPEPSPPADSSARSLMEELVPTMLRLLVPRLASPAALARLGAAEAVAALVAACGARLARFVVLLVVPLLRCMSDADAGVRAVASRCAGNWVVCGGVGDG